MNRKYSKILIADDDFDDRTLIKKAFKELNMENQLQFAADGVALMDMLNEKENEMKPSIIFLDLNMPKKDGRQALREIKDNETLRKIPVIIFTTSQSKDDIDSTYLTGANCFITKPRTFSDLLKTVKNIVDFWFETATLPGAAV